MNSLFLVSKTDFSPKGEVAQIENLHLKPIDEDFDGIEKRIKEYPHLRERFRYDLKKKGKYTPFRIFFTKETTISSEQDFRLDYNDKTISYFPDKNRIGQPIVGSEILKSVIHPDEIFNDPNGKNKRYYIMNITDSPVFVGIGNKKINSFRVIHFVHLQSVPEVFFNFHGFRECFYGEDHRLIFITEEQYRKSKKIIEKKEALEEKRLNEIKERMSERGGHAGGRSEGLSVRSDYSHEEGEKKYGKVVDGVYLYGDTSVNLNQSDSQENYASETIKVDNANSPGLSQILSMAKGKERVSVSEEGLMSSEDLNSILNLIE